MKIILDFDDVSALVFDEMARLGFYDRETEEAHLKWSVDETIGIDSLRAKFSTNPLTNSEGVTKEE